MRERKALPHPPSVQSMRFMDPLGSNSPKQEEEKKPEFVAFKPSSKTEESAVVPQHVTVEKKYQPDDEILALKFTSIHVRASIVLQSYARRRFARKTVKRKSLGNM